VSRPYADSAQRYWRAGWPNPIPVKGKDHPPAGFTGYNGANVSWPDLQGWCEGAQAGHNIALRLPADIVGIDVDAYGGKVGEASLAAAEAELGPLPATWRSTSRAPFTASGIRFYRVASGVDLRGAEKRFVARFGDHVDILRRDHRYAVVWPSVHPDTGATYAWYDPAGAECAPPAPAQLPELPAAWQHFLSTPLGPAPPTADTATPASSPWDLPREFTQEQAIEFVRPAFERVRAAVDGTINNRLNEAAVTIGHFVPDFFSRDEAQRWLLDALTSTVYDGKTWRAENTIASGLGAKTWRAVKVDQRAEPTAAAMEEDIIARFPRLDWHSLWAEEDAEEWIVEPILPARRLVAIYSPPKIGKSLLSLELAVGIARGSSVLGVRPDRARRVLYVDFENDPRGDIRPRLASMGVGPDDLDNIDYLSFPTLGPLDTAPGAAELLGAVDAYRSEVVIIDTVSRAVRGEENENDTWLAFYRHTGRWLKTRGVALIRLDHTGKDETKGQRGGSAKSGDVDMVWRLSKVTETVYRLECEVADPAPGDDAAALAPGGDRAAGSLASRAGRRTSHPRRGLAAP
jgi:hypothetical protein